MTVHGVLLAAGAGSRMGRPKALVADADGPWLTRGVRTLLDGGCAGVVVVLGAAATEARALLEGRRSISTGSTRRRSEERQRRASVETPAAEATAVTTVVATDWADGMSASLRAGLTALAPTSAEAALLHLVDLPDVGADVVRRVLADGAGRADLRRAAYSGVPGHPVLLGREHWPGVLATAAGDEGARGYLRRHPAGLVECGDLAGGDDVDAPTGGQRPTS